MDSNGNGPRERSGVGVVLIGEGLHFPDGLFDAGTDVELFFFREFEGVAFGQIDVLVGSEGVGIRPDSGKYFCRKSLFLA
jgi:hypothetical protein